MELPPPSRVKSLISYQLPEKPNMSTFGYIILSKHETNNFAETNKSSYWRYYGGTIAKNFRWRQCGCTQAKCKCCIDIVDTLQEVDQSPEQQERN